MANPELSAQPQNGLTRKPLVPDKDRTIQELRQKICELETRREKAVLAQELVIQGLRRKIVSLEHQLQRRELETLTDELTQVANLRAFNFGLAREWKRCRREQQPLSLLRIDLDYFQPYCDAHGQFAGNRLLQDVAAAILFCVDRPGDLAACLGREKFGVILPNTPLAGAQKIGQQILEFVHQVAYLQTDRHTHASISMGSASEAPSQLSSGKSPRTLLTAADQALYWAKAQGRDRIVVCSTPQA
ncbi:MAG: GGDEF domain-containing protein [Leptolyngbyaceae cyanobacterium MO_188.B28]|nr:GGDEF domain-containing protein [Leptolyngbyaceae cyanobacterium MO_188.B28]